MKKKLQKNKIENTKKGEEEIKQKWNRTDNKRETTTRIKGKARRWRINYKKKRNIKERRNYKRD